ncbi:hypothetical protein SAMN02745866_03632 [Alteromonadaceae bacterium Bs31]|nr:hypothetical protein SAMN02745866_03632 [Alteromonadaceae bacterium Bs31]
MKKIVILGALWLASTSAFSDTGIGVSFQSNDGRILVPYDVSESFRIEPSFRYYSVDNSDSYDYENYELGLGLFHRKETIPNMSFLLGARVGYINSTQGYGDSSEISYDGYFLAPALGLEYFVGDKFSVGGEISLRYESIDSESYDSTSTYTDSAFIARFYF